jgi:hypothetical protein
MRAGIQLGFRILTKYVILLVLSMLFIMLVPANLLWLQVILNLMLLAGFAFLTWSEAGYYGERAETLRVALEARRAKGEQIDPALEDTAFKPRTALIGFFVGALPLLIVAMLNLVTLPAYPQSLDPASFEVSDEILALEAQLAAEQAALPDLEGAPVQSPAPSDETQPDAQSALPAEAGETQPDAQSALPAEADETQPDAQSALPAEADETQPDAQSALPAEADETQAFNPYNTIARLVFMPFVSVYTLLAKHLMVLYILMVPFSFFLPAFGLIGYLNGPKLRKKKLEAIKKGIRAKKRKERRARKPSAGPKPEV